MARARRLRRARSLPVAAVLECEDEIVAVELAVGVPVAGGPRGVAPYVVVVPCRDAQAHNCVRWDLLHRDGGQQEDRESRPESGKTCPEVSTACHDRALQKRDRRTPPVYRGWGVHNQPASRRPHQGTHRTVGRVSCTCPSDGTGIVPICTCRKWAGTLHRREILSDRCNARHRPGADPLTRAA